MYNLPISINNEPSPSIFASFAPSASSQNNSNDSSEFSKILGAELEDSTHSKDTEDVFRRAALESMEDENNLAGAPYINVSAFDQSKHNLDIRLTNKEVETIAKNLYEANKDLNNQTLRDSINLINNLGKMPGGTTAREIINTLRGEFEKESNLSEPDKKHLENLAAKIANNQDAFTNLKSALQNGSSQGAMDLIMQNLNKMNPNQSLSLNKEELSALTKALQLSPEASTALKSFMGNNNKMSVNPKELDAMLSVARKDVQDKTDSQSRLLSSLENSMQGVLKDAKAREDMEALASSREDKSVFYTRLQMENTSTKKAQNALEGKPEINAKVSLEETEKNALNGKSAKTEAKKDIKLEKSADFDNQEHINIKLLKQQINSDTEQKVETKLGEQNFVNSASDKKVLDKHLGEKQEESFGDPKQKSAPENKKPILEAKAESQVISAPNPLATNQNLVFAAPKIEVRGTQELAQAIYHGKQNGVQSLELQLHPLELGAVSVLLQSKNGEINAIIKPEFAETAQVLNAQVDAIRKELEDQGIKVGKLEIQNQNPEDQAGQNSSNMQDGQSQQQAQDLQDKSEHLERLRRLAKMELNSTGQELPEFDLAQKVQNISQQATITRHEEGIHFVA